MRLALLRTQSDVRLAALARDGSEAAFALIVERHRRAVLAACRRILPEARAEDASQQVFMAAWRALGRGDEVRDVRPWLLRIARNTSLNALRVQGYDYDELRDGLRVGAAPDEELERRDVIRQTLAGLAALPERQREVLLRSAVEGAPHADIARDLGLSEGATRQLMLRARTTLRAAASALTPWPLVVWAAQAGGGAAAAGGAGAVAAKVGVAAVLAGGVAVGTPAIVEHDPRTPERRPAAAAMAAPAAVEKIAEKVPTPAATAAPTPRATAAPAPSPEARPQRTPRAEERRVSHRGPSGGGSSGPGPDEDEPDERDERDDSSGSSSGDAEPEDDATDNSGPGSTDSGTSGSESGSASSGSDDMPDEDELLDDHSGSDSESSGSGS